MSTTPSTDPLIGGPVSDQEQAAYAAWAERIEADDYAPAPDGEALVGDDATRSSTELLEAIIGAEALARAIGRGRPGLEGRAGAGPSVKRQVRLPQDLDARLTARAEEEHVELSVIMRRAIDTYLKQPA